MKTTTKQTTLRQGVEQVLDPSGHWQASKRLIQCTPVFGDYGQPAYWMIVLDGSPPKAAIIIQTGWNKYVSSKQNGQPMPIRIASDGTTKKLSTRTAEPLNALMGMLYDKLTGGKKTADQYFPSLVRPRAFSLCLDGSIAEIREEPCAESAPS